MSAFDRLPEAMRRTDRPESLLIAQALLGWQDEIVSAAALEAADFFFDHMAAQSCKVSSLDWAARFYGFDGEFWDGSWSELHKRDLLYYFRQLWAYRGDPRTLQFLFDLFELDAKIKPNDGWILGGEREINPGVIGGPTETIQGTPFNIRLAGSPLQFYIVIPPRYTESTPELKLIKKLRKLWLSNAVETVYQYRSAN